MLLVWRLTSLLETRYPLQLVVLLETEHNWIQFHRMWKTCGLVVLIHRGSYNTHSMHFSQYNHWLLVMACSGKWPLLNWATFLLFSPLVLVNPVSIMLHPSHWLVWLIEWIEFIDLPQLQSVKLGYAAFYRCQSVVFESDWMDGLMIQICPNYNPFNLVGLLFVVMVVENERRLALYHTTTRTHWQCEVRLNERMND